MRTVKEWVGKTDDSMPSPHVRLRIFNDHGGLCLLSGRKIMPQDKWHLDHIVAICNGGENRESNLAPVLVQPHREKTKRDRAVKSKNDRVRMKHIGIFKPRTMTRWRRFNGEIVTAPRSR